MPVRVSDICPDCAERLVRSDLFVKDVGAGHRIMACSKCSYVGDYDAAFQEAVAKARADGEARGRLRGRMEAELSDHIRRRIGEVFGTPKPPSDVKRDLLKIIALAHPDKHTGEARALAHEVTVALIALRDKL